MAETSFLHITNGDGAAGVLRESNVIGALLPWRDPMHHGPFYAGLDLNRSSQIRARYLAAPIDNQREQAEREFIARDDCLTKAADNDEVVLWFEHDLLDQLQILQILYELAKARIKPQSLTMICIDHYAGIDLFRGLGQLTARQMTSLFDSRRTVTRAQLELATIGWTAFVSQNPETLETFLGGDLSALPFLHAALRRHLEDFPWVTDGLTRTERQILRLVAGGVSQPGKIFGDNMALESVLYIGDSRTYHHIATLCHCRHPLLTCAPHGEFRSPPRAQLSQQDFLAQRLSPTAAGLSVVNGEAHAAQCVERDEWLGGVHLGNSDPMWLWDPDQQRLSHKTR